MAVIKELDRRGTLKNALAGRDEQGLSRLLNFLLGYATPTYTYRICLIINLKKDHKPFYSFSPQEFDRQQVYTCLGNSS